MCTTALVMQAKPGKVNYCIPPTRILSTLPNLMGDPKKLYCDLLYLPFGAFCKRCFSLELHLLLLCSLGPLICRRPCKTLPLSRILFPSKNIPSLEEEVQGPHG